MRPQFLIGIFVLAVACRGVTPEPTPQVEATNPPSVARRATPSPGATRTLTATLSPTATQKPPERYFIEDFDDVPLHWATVYASGVSGEVEIVSNDGSLIFEIYSPVTWVYAMYGAFEYTQVHLETRVQSRGSDLNAMGLVCHYDEQEGWFEFNISSDGTYSVLYGQWLAAGIAQYTPILRDSSDRIEQGDAVNEIGLDCLDADLQLYINGKLIRRVNVSRYELIGGKIGLSIGSFEEIPVLLAFDWMKVREISPE